MSFLPLPQLLPRIPSLAAPACLRLLASYHPIGFANDETVRVDETDGVTTALYHDAPMGFLAHAVPALVANRSHRNDPTFVALYVGMSGFVPMLGILSEITRIRPHTRSVLLACGCVSEDQREILNRLLRNRSVSAVGWCGCGGTREMNALRLTLNGIPTDEAIRLTPGLPSTDAGLSLDA